MPERRHRRMVEIPRQPVARPELNAAAVAPAVADGADRHIWRGHGGRTALYVAQLAHEPTWNELAARMRTIAATVCDPAKIHRQFLDEMPRRQRIV